MKTQLRKLTVLVVLLCSFGSVAQAQVAINSTTFPDEAFRNWVNNQDKDGDGESPDGLGD